MNTYSLPGANNWQRIKDAHHAHIKASMNEMDFVINELYELAEYLSDPNNNHEHRYVEIVSEALEYLHDAKEHNEPQSL